MSSEIMIAGMLHY